MKKISVCFRMTYAFLEERGVPKSELWEFHRLINRAMAAAKVGNYEATAGNLKAMQFKMDRYVDLSFARNASGGKARR